MSILDIITHFLTGSVVQTSTGWELDVPGGGVGFLLHPVSGSISIFAFMVCLGLLLNFYRRTKDKIKKKQTFYLLIGIGILVLLYGSDFILSFFPINFPPLSLFGVTIFSLLLANSMIRYELFSLDPITAAENILNTMSEMLFILDPTGKIVNVNPATLRNLDYRKSEVIGNDLSIFDSKEDKISLSQSIRSEILYKNIVNNKHGNLQTKFGKQLPVSMSCTTMRGEEKELIGIVCVVRDLSDVEKSEKRLASYTSDLEQMNKLMIGREVKMYELKKEIEKLRDEIRKK
jgi:PAS domain S-box-containing protein